MTLKLKNTLVSNVWSSVAYLLDIPDNYDKVYYDLLRLLIVFCRIYKVVLRSLFSTKICQDKARKSSVPSHLLLSQQSFTRCFTKLLSISPPIIRRLRKSIRWSGWIYCLRHSDGCNAEQSPNLSFTFVRDQTCNIFHILWILQTLQFIVKPPQC